MTEFKKFRTEPAEHQEETPLSFEMIATNLRNLGMKEKTGTYIFYHKKDGNSTMTIDYTPGVSIKLSTQLHPNYPDSEFIIKQDNTINGSGDLSSREELLGILLRYLIDDFLLVNPTKTKIATILRNNPKKKR